jgi:hypothetical protein
VWRFNRGDEQMTKDEALKLALEALEANRRTHYYCEDTWYSCPKHEDGCANEAEGNECNCGADKANAEIDYVTAAIKEALAQPEPVAWEQFYPEMGSPKLSYLSPTESTHNACYIPPQRTWVGLTDEEILSISADCATTHQHMDIQFARAIEAKLRTKNT